MRAPFQEPDPRHFRVPGNRRTLFGSAAALGGALIKSLLPKSSTGIRLKAPTANRLRSYASSRILSLSPASFALSKKKVAFHTRRSTRRAKKFVYKKNRLRFTVRRNTRSRRRHKSYRLHSYSRFKYRARHRKNRFHRRYYFKRLR